MRSRSVPLSVLSVRLFSFIFYMHVQDVIVSAMHTRRLVLLTVALLVSMGLFMTINSGGHWDFVLPFRGAKLVALLVVAYAIAISTILFQTITSNRILTPYIMGFDALYLLIQTVLIFVFGSLAAYCSNFSLIYNFSFLSISRRVWSFLPSIMRRRSLKICKLMQRCRFMRVFCLL